MYKSANTQRSATALSVSRTTKLTNTPRIASARNELVRKHLARPIYVIRNTLDRRYMRAQCPHFCVISDCRAQSHIVDAWPTHWKLFCFCQSVFRASVGRQHSLLVRGGRCINATHIFVRSVIAKGSWVCLKYWAHMSAYKGTRQKTASTLEQRYINAKYFCFVSHGCPFRAPGNRGQRACAALRCMSAQSKRWAHAGSAPSARATGCDYAISAA